MKKRILSWALVLCMVLALLPSAAFAADVVASGTCGLKDNCEPVDVPEDNDVRWTLDSAGTLTVFGHGEMGAWYKGGMPPWYGYGDSIRSVIIKDGVTSVGSFAFTGCTKLNHIELSDTVSSIGGCAFEGTAYYNNADNWIDDIFYIDDFAIQPKNWQEVTTVTIKNGTRFIAEDAFINCKKLISVSIPTSVVAIGANAFSGCENLSEIVIPNGVATIGDSAFSGCKNVSEIVIPDSVVVIGYSAFFGCKNLETITLSKNVTSVGGYAFSGTAYAENTQNWSDGALYLGDILLQVKSDVTELHVRAGTKMIADRVAYWKDLTSVTLPDGLVYIGKRAFASNYELKSVSIPESVTYIGDSAFYADRIPTIAIPASVTYIGEHAFTLGVSKEIIVDENNANYMSKDGVLFTKDGSTLIAYPCYKGETSYEVPNGVKRIELEAFEGADCTEISLPDSVITIGENAFYHCWSLEKINLPRWLESNGAHAFSSCPNLISAGPTGGGYNIEFDWTTKIPDNAFSGADSLTNVVIPTGISSIGNAAFYQCGDLTSIDLPDSVTSIGDETFCVCSSLTSIAIPDGVTSIGNAAFSGCRGLTSVIIPDSVTSIGHSAFSDCSGLTSVTIPNSVTSIGDFAFSRCSSLTSVTIPEGVTRIGSSAFSGCSGLTSVTIPEGVTRIGSSAFSGCSGLTSIDIPDSVTYIGDGAFSDCKGLTSIYIPDGVTNIGKFTFADCTGLTSMTVPDGVTSINLGAFLRCSSLTSITIPISVASIGNFAFKDCSSLTDVYYGGTEEQWGAITVDDENDPLINATIHFTDPPVHEHSYTAVVTNPTCTDKGYTTHTCACGHSYVDSYVDTLGHAWDAGVVTTAPTATTDGVKTYTCTVCGETRTEAIPATGEKPIDPVTPIDPTTVFTDVSHDWAYPGIEYCYNHGLMAGTSNTTFSPDDALTRGQFVAILWRQLDRPAPQGQNPFTDLTQDYYKDAITWAAENGIVYGATDSTFEPDRAITRQELTTMFYRYVRNYLKQDVSGTTDVTGFPDYGKVADYAREAMAWAKGVGLITGNEIGGTIYLDPLGAATRAQAATMFMNLCERVLK